LASRGVEAAHLQAHSATSRRSPIRSEAWPPRQETLMRLYRTRNTEHIETVNAGSIPAMVE
jgi:hypothetical protein